MVPPPPPDAIPGFPPLITEPDMEGFFTRAEAPGAFGNGTRITKIVEEPGDTHRKGALGTVLGSVGPMPYQGVSAVYGYFIAWDAQPKRAVLCISLKLEKSILN